MSINPPSKLFPPFSRAVQHRNKHIDTVDMERFSSESGDDHEYEDDHDHRHTRTQEQESVASDETAPAKRKRLTQACDPCRKKKIKCDGVRPSCANCTKLKAGCTYLPSMKKRGPRQGYIELLEKRLDKMEQLLHRGPVAAVDPELMDSTSILNSRLRPGNQRSMSPADTGPTPDSEERFFGTASGYSSQHAEYHKQKDLSTGVVGPKHSQSAQSHQDRPRNPIYGIKDEVPRRDILDHLIELFFDSLCYQLPIVHPGTFMKQYKEGKVSPNLLNAMCAAVARFSDHPDVVTTPPFLAGEPFATNVRGMVVDSIDIPTVSNVQALVFLSMYEYGAARGPRAWMFGGMAVRQAQELGLDREDSSPLFHLKGDWVMRETRRRTFWACFMLDVLASSSSGRPRMMDERDCEVLLPSEDHDWHDKRPVVTDMLDDEVDFSGTENEASTKPGTSCKEGQANSEQDAVPIIPIAPTDHTASEATTNLSQVDSGSESGDFSSQSSKAQKQGAGHILSSFAYLIRIVAVLGKVSQYVNRPRTKKAIPPNQQGSEFSVIDATLTGWLKSIPPHLTYSLENGRLLKDKSEGCVIVFMHVIYYTAVVLLHRPILAADKTSFPLDSTFVDNSVERCADAASKVSDVLEFVQAYNCPPRIFISSFFAYPVFTTATIHITNAFASDLVVATRARRSLSTHVKVLQTMKLYWSMADKFFYIIRDLYSIQSKISSSGSKTTGSSTPFNSTPGQSTNTSGNGIRESSDVSGSHSGPTFGGDDRPSEPATASAGTLTEPATNTKLASISSFLKSDSGLIALWRRATEMQVLDEAKQEQRRLSVTEEAARSPTSLEEKKGLHPQDIALQEHRERMNALEIQQINQEFDRRWKPKLGASLLSEDMSAALPPGGDPHYQAAGQKSTALEKRPKDEESENPKAAKQARVVKASKTVRTSSRKTRGGSLSDTDESEPVTHPNNAAPEDSNVVQEHGSFKDLSTYGQLGLQQPHQQQQQQGLNLLQTMQIQSSHISPSGTGVPAMGATGQVNPHLMEIYTQQHQQHTALSQSIEMMQNTNIQRQQQQLRFQQERAAQMSSLAYGPPGGFGSSFMTPSSLQDQQEFSAQNLSSEPLFGLPLVYGSNYGNNQAQSRPPESLGSLFDFALPQGDISFLSNSFQVSPTLMQENIGFTNISSIPLSPSGNNSIGQGIRAPGPGSIGEDMTGPGPAISGTSSTPMNRPPSQSPTSDPSNLFDISPRMQSFLLPDETLLEASEGGVAATPSNLIRYLQHHHQQEMQQHEQLRQQNIQPVLNQQNSLIFDDYFPWNHFSILPQHQQP